MARPRMSAERGPGCWVLLGIAFRVVGWTLDLAQRDVLRRRVVPQMPPAGLGLTVALAQPRIPVLTIIHRGTVGLMGPTRADRNDRLRLVWAALEATGSIWLWPALNGQGTVRVTANR